jgi:hypothetical protein
MMLPDTNAPIACEVESTGVLGIVRFVNSPSPRLLFTSVPFADTVRVGQRVLTSSLSRRYPRGIPVGRIVHLGSDPNGLTQAIEVAPGDPHRDHTRALALHRRHAQAEIGGPAAERCDPGSGVAGRAPGNLHRRAHVAIKLLGSLLIDEPHHPLGQRMFGQERILDPREHIDNRIANA